MSAEATWFLGMTLDELEKIVLLKTLEHFKDNKIFTAKALGISDRVIYDKLKKYKEQDAQAAARLEEINKKQLEADKRARGVFVIENGSAVFLAPSDITEEMKPGDNTPSTPIAAPPGIPVPGPAGAGVDPLAPKMPAPGVKLDAAGYPIHEAEPDLGSSSADPKAKKSKKPAVIK